MNVELVKGAAVIISMILKTVITTCFCSMVSSILFGTKSVIEYIIWSCKEHAEGKIVNLKSTEAKYSLNEIKSRQFIFDTEVCVNGERFTVDYVKTEKKEKPCSVNVGDTVSLFVNAKTKTVKDSANLKKNISQQLITFFASLTTIIVSCVAVVIFL